MNSVKNTGFRSLNKRSSKSAIQLATAWEPSSTRSWGLSHNAELMSRIAWLQTHDSEKAMAPHSSTLAWKIPWTEEPGRLQSMGLLRVGHDWAPSLSLFTFLHWRRKWQPTTVFLPGESQGWGSLVGCRLWGCTESDTIEVTQHQQAKEIYWILSRLWMLLWDLDRQIRRRQWHPTPVLLPGKSHGWRSLVGCSPRGR